MALVLNVAERRVLGVLIEKGLSTPEQYPLTLNSLVLGCNQKSCRDPMTSLGEDDVLRAVDSLRSKQLVTVVRAAGSRADRYKHRAADTLKIEGKEAAVVAELLLRGPQSDGELRAHASRLVPIPGLPELAVVIEKLRQREEPFVVRLGGEGRRRGIKYAHTFYTDNERPREEDFEEVEDAAAAGPAHPAAPPPAVAVSPPLGSAASRAPLGPSPLSGGASNGAVEELRRELTLLKERVEELEATFARFFK
jgi:hypothetical protein